MEPIPHPRTGRSIAGFLGPLQHAYWQKGAEVYGMLEERTTRVRPQKLHALLRLTLHVTATSFWTIVA
jgi:hypothetical protein